VGELYRVAAVAAFVALQACAGSPSVRVVAPVRVTLDEDADALASREVALFGRVLVGGRIVSYAGSGFTWSARSSCYEATGWPEGKTATTEDHLRVRLCPDDAGRFATELSLAIGGELREIDPRARVDVAIDESRNVVVLAFAYVLTSAEPGVIAGPGAGAYVFDTGGASRFAGRIAATIRWRDGHAPQPRRPPSAPPEPEPAPVGTTSRR
jgi:hypothetical protein